MVATKSLVDAWIRYSKESSATNTPAGPFFWAWEEVEDTVARNPVVGFSLILEILARDASQEVLASLAAGPLENLLAAHGPTIIEHVEAEAFRNPLFRDLLGGVWENSIRRDIWERVQQLVLERW